MPTIVITRIKLYRRGVPGPAWVWSYNYQVPGDPYTSQYGPGLADLKAYLRRRYPEYKVVEAWK